MKDFLYGILLKRVKRWTRAGIIQETEKALAMLKPGSRVLSIGGFGATDIQLVKICKKYELLVETANIDSKYSPDFIVDIGSGSIGIKERYSAIVVLEVFEHVVEYKQAVLNLSELLEEDGVVVVSVPWIIPIHDKPSDFRRYTHFELDRIFSPYFFVSIGARGGYAQSILVLGLRGLISGGITGKAICMVSFLISFLAKKPEIKFAETRELPDSTIGYFLIGKRKLISSK